MASHITFSGTQTNVANARGAMYLLLMHLKSGNMRPMSVSNFLSKYHTNDLVGREVWVRGHGLVVDVKRGSSARFGEVAFPFHTIDTVYVSHDEFFAKKTRGNVSSAMDSGAQSATSNDGRENACEKASAAATSPPLAAARVTNPFRTPLQAAQSAPRTPGAPRKRQHARAHQFWKQ